MILYKNAVPIQGVLCICYEYCITIATLEMSSPASDLSVLLLSNCQVLVAIQQQVCMHIDAATYMLRWAWHRLYTAKQAV